MENEYVDLVIDNIYILGLVVYSVSAIVIAFILNKMKNDIKKLNQKS